MLTREQYDQVISTFFVELNHLCLDASEECLTALPRLKSEIPAYLADLRDKENDAGQTLYHAFGFVDEFIHADWERVASTGFEAYRKSQSSPPIA